MKKAVLCSALALTMSASATEVYYTATADGLTSKLEILDAAKAHPVDGYSEQVAQFASDNGIEYVSVQKTLNATVLLTNDGRVVTYGNGNDVALCNDAPYNGWPQFVSSINAEVVQIETTGEAWIARDANGGVWGCGDNSHLQFGDIRWQYITTSSPAQQLSVPGFVTDVAISGYVFAATTDTGEVYMSGYTYDQDIQDTYGSKVSGLQNVSFNFNNEVVKGVSSAGRNVYVITEQSIYTNMLGVFLAADHIFESHGIDKAAVDETLYKKQFFPFYTFPEPEPEPEVTETEPTEGDKKKCKKKKCKKKKCKKKGKGHKKGKGKGHKKGHDCHN